MADGGHAVAQREPTPAQAAPVPTSVADRAKDMTPPPKPAVAHDDPRLAHAANAPVRVAALRDMQRGLGNQAVQATVAGVGGRAAPRREPPPREQEPAEDMQAVPPETGPSEAEQPLLPLMPLTPEPLRADYEAPQTIGPGVLSFPHHARSAAQEAEAQASAEAGFAALRSAAESKHAQTLGEANRALGTAVQAYAEAAERLDSYQQRCETQIDTMQQMALAAVDQSADTAIQLSRAAHDAAVKALAAIVLRAHGRVAGMQTLADNDAKSVVSDAVKQYTDAFAKAKKDVTDQEKAAEDGLSGWLKTLDKAYPMKFDDLQRAQAEARRQVAPQLAGSDTKQIQANRDGIIKSFDESAPKLTAQVSSSLQEQIAKNTKAAIAKGYETVETARKQAQSGLEQQLHDSIQAMEQMRRSGQASVRAGAAAARIRIAGVVRARKSALRSNASQAMEGVTVGVQPALRLYAASPDRLTSSLRWAARRGAEALRQVAQTAPTGIRAAMDNAQRMHAERAAANAAAMNGMQTREEQQCAAEAEAKLARSRLQIDRSADGTAQQIDRNAAEQQRAFSQIAENVHATAESWATAYGAGLSASMAAYRKAAAEGFHTFMTGEVPKGATQPAGSGGEKAKPFNETLATIKAEFDKRLTSDSIVALFEEAMKSIDDQVKKRLTGIANSAMAAAERGDGKAVTEPLRNITATEGAAIIQLSTSLATHTALDYYLLLQNSRGILDDDDYHAAMAYLRGNPVEGVRYEIKSALGFWSDDKQRIEAAMRNLTPEQAKQLEGSDAFEQARGWWHLGGTDLEVFNALAAGEVAKADAIRAIQQVDQAKRSGEYDKLNASLTTAFSATSYGGKQVDADTHRKEVQAQMASILRGRQTADPTAASLDDKTVIANFVTEQVEVPVGGGEAATTMTLQIDGANKALAVALIDEGPDSLAAQTARLGIEYQRPDGPTVVTLDTALVDERLNPKSLLTEDGKQKTGEALAKAQDERRKAQEDRDKVIVDFVRTYCDADPNIKPEDARKLAAEKFGDKLGPDSKGGSEYVTALFTEGYVSPQTAARGMSYAMYASFWHTDKDLMRQIVGRMNADEITQMRASFRTYTGKDLYDELGVYHHGGLFTTLSGDTRLEFERLLLGQPRNDYERAQLALFTIEQQRRETGAVGKFLAGGSYAEAAMEQTRAELIASLGGKAEVDADGQLKVPAGIFGTGPDDRGQFKSTNREQFDLAVSMSKAVADNYAARIDDIASSVTTAIAVIGTIVAAVVTVATGGAAAPLLMGAIALTAGLAGMGAHRLISGGRYGWHEAARDFGMTLVQALTAGLGAQLGILSRGGIAAIEAAEVAEEAAAAGTMTAEELAAARGGAEMGQILGSKAADMALIGVTTGAMTGAGQALFNEKSWEKGAMGALEAMLEGTIRGALAGLATSVASQAVEAVPLRAGPGGTLGEIMGGLGRDRGNLAWQSVGRGVLKSITSSVGAMAGRSVEVGWDKATGRFNGSAAEEIVHAGAFAALQGGLEGMAEAPTERWRASRQAMRIQALREQGEAANREPPKPPAPAVPSRVEAEPLRVLPTEAPPMPRVQPAAAPGEPTAEALVGRPGAPRAPIEELPGRPGAPRTTGEPPSADEPPSPLRLRGDVALLPEETVIRPPNATSIDEAHEIYGNVISDQPDREAAIYRNPVTGEFIVIQGEAEAVGVRATAGGELESPGPAGSAQRWKELLEGPDIGRWELVAHFHPANQPGGGISLPMRMPSGSPGDFQVMEGEAFEAGTARQSRIHYIDGGRWGYTDFGYDPRSVTARYWVEHADAVGGGRTRVEFASLDQYREWFHSNFNRSPDTTWAPPRAPAMPHVPQAEPPRAVVREIDTMLVGGVPIEHPPPAIVAKARLAFEQGTATAGDLEVLMRKAMADARTVLATEDLPHPSLTRDDWDRFTYDLAALSWYCVRGQCGVGRDYIATSMGTLLMDADHPIVFQRFQAKEVFGVGKHAFAIVAVKDEPGWAFILDPTFAQFMRPPGRTLDMQSATADVLREHETGAFMARDLLRDGFIPLTRDNAALYARAMGVPEDQAAAMGARLLHGDAAELTELVGGPERRPPVTHITSNDIETISVLELQGMLARHVDDLSGRGGGHQTERSQLADLQRRLGEALQRGEVRPEPEGGPPARPGPRPVPRAPQPTEPAPSAPETVPEPPSMAPPPVGLLAPPRPVAAEAVGERFRGDLYIGGSLAGSTLTDTVERLGTAPGALQGRLERIGEGWPPTYSLRTRTGEVQVAMEVTDAMPRRDAGVPVARAEPDPASGGYRVQVSARADRYATYGSVERALAGVLTELVAGHRVPELPDVLRPGGSGGRLSAADEGRLAQLATLGRSLQRSRLPEIRTALQLQAEELVDAMGLTGASAAAAARREAALRHPGLTDPDRTLLTQASEMAATNPFLLNFTGDRTRDLPLLERSLARIATLGSEEDARVWRAQLATDLAQSLIDQRIVMRTPGRPGVNMAELGALLGLPPLDAAQALGAPKDPVHALVAQARDIAVDGLARHALMPSDSRRPTPGFEAEVVSARTGRLVPASASGEFRKGALSLEAAIKPAGERVDGLVRTRTDAVRESGSLEEELALTATPERRRNEIRDRLAVLGTIINVASEALGTEAGLAYARARLSGFARVELPGTGAGVPDLVFEHPDGRIVVIECKGGDARLGTRLDASGRFLVQQGTIEYLRSLAATMAASDPGPIRALGERMQIELVSEQPRIEYELVRQPFNPDGSLASPQYGSFDLHANERRP